jgi:hypothetical protein
VLVRFAEVLRAECCVLGNSAACDAEMESGGVRWRRSGVLQDSTVSLTIAPPSQATSAERCARRAHARVSSSGSYPARSTQHLRSATALKALTDPFGSVVVLQGWTAAAGWWGSRKLSE